MNDPQRSKTILVTGGNAGIGLATAKALAGRGHRVIIACRNADKAKEAIRLIQDAAPNASVSFRRLDLASLDGTRRFAEAFLEDFPSLDVLINNAGGNSPQAFTEVDLDTLDHLLALNVRSMFVTAQAAVRAMQRLGTQEGAIVHMSSQMGHVGAPNRSVYCLTKHAIEGLTKAMAVELAPQGIRVNAVAPTFIETPLTAPFFEDPAFKADTLSKIPLGRIGQADEVAAAVLFLASPAASLITGTSLLVDGGYTAR